MGSENHGIFVYKRPTLFIESKKSLVKELNTKKAGSYSSGR